jgi:hypothetical protein
VALCAIYTVHVETRSASFLGEPQNQGQRFVSGLASKPPGRFLIGLGSKPMVTVSISLTLKPAATVSTGLASKSVVGFLVEGFLVCGSKSAALIW